MKKVYEKPQIYMERFELSQSIAACATKMNSGSPETCTGTAWDFDGITVFLEGVGCTVPEGYCYEPSANGNIFMS